MEVIVIPLHQVRVKKSKYLFLQVAGWNNEDNKLSALANSIKSTGIQLPLLIHKSGDEVHLVDGFKRAVVAKSLEIENIPCCFLPEDISLRDVLAFLFIEQNELIISSLVTRARFVAFAQKQGLDNTTLLEYYFPLLGLKSHAAVLKKLKAIDKLPQKVLDFCDEKHFSMRQCSSLTRYPSDLLSQVFSWKDELYLTASMAEEILTNLKDYLRGTGISLAEFVDDKEVKDLSNSSLSSQERTRRFRSLLKKRRFPILTDVNIKMDHIRKQISLPDNIKLSWDPTLEKRELRLALTIHEPEDWDNNLKVLKKVSLKQGIADMLKDL